MSFRPDVRPPIQDMPPRGGFPSVSLLGCLNTNFNRSLIIVDVNRVVFYYTFR